ncbi:MAG: DUF2252 family protein [Phycisphaerae bacterium]|nr:DUF2252 family protein [Phycisphaerae bacterium]
MTFRNRDATRLARHALNLRVALLAAMMAFAAVSQHADADEVLGTLQRMNSHLSTDIPNALPIRINSLRRGPNDFFRGTADLFYSWCREHCTEWAADRDGVVQLHGDIHAGNIGTYRIGGNSGELCFSLVDLDETCAGYFAFDLLRAAVSLRFAAIENGITLSDEKWERVSEQLCDGYASGLCGDVPDERLRSEFPVVRALLAKAEETDAAEYFGRFVDRSDGTRFRDVVIKKGRVADINETVDSDARSAVVSSLRGFFDGESAAARRRQIGIKDARELDSAVLDVVRWTRLDSSGSQGVRKFLVLLKANGGPGADMMILQLKEEPAPAAERVGLVKPASGANRAEAVAAAHVPLQCHHSEWVGAVVMGGVPCLVKPKSPYSKEPSAKDLNRPREIEEMARLMGTLLGRGHANSIGNDPGRIDAIRERLRAAAPVLNNRSADAAVFLREAYESLIRNPDAARLSQVAESWIAERTGRHTKSAGKKKPGRSD